jgi:hypothetical protein
MWLCFASTRRLGGSLVVSALSVLQKAFFTPLSSSFRIHTLSFCLTLSSLVFFELTLGLLLVLLPRQPETLGSSCVRVRPLPHSSSSSDLYLHTYIFLLLRLLPSLSPSHSSSSSDLYLHTYIFLLLRLLPSLSPSTNRILSAQEIRSCHTGGHVSGSNSGFLCVPAVPPNRHRAALRRDLTMTSHIRWTIMRLLRSSTLHDPRKIEDLSIPRGPKMLLHSLIISGPRQSSSHLL